MDLEYLKLTIIVILLIVIIYYVTFKFQYKQKEQFLDPRDAFTSHESFTPSAGILTQDIFRSDVAFDEQNDSAYR